MKMNGYKMYARTDYKNNLCVKVHTRICNDGDNIDNPS